MTTTLHRGAGAREASLVAGEFVLRAEDFRSIAAILHADAGIVIPEGKAALLYSRLARRLRALGLDSFRAYCALIADVRGVDERQRMLAALTTNVTRFFREPHHFEDLRTRVLPPLLRHAEAGGRVRLWSAGCSRGHEPYSLAITLLSLLPNAGEYDIRILASDVDVDVLAEGEAGEYAAEVLADVPAPGRRFFAPVGGTGRTRWRVLDEVRDLVAFRELNLVGPWPMSGTFQVIMCRNVAIYFDEATQTSTFVRFAGALAPAGRLYVGHSERLTGAAAALYRSEGITIYGLARDAPR